MSLTAKLNYDDFVLAADKLFYEHMEMPTAAKTHHLIGHGSLATHQHYLNRWKESRKRKPATLSEQLEEKIVGQSKAYAEDIWKALSKSNQESHQKIQKDAREAVDKAQAEAQEAQQARKSTEQTLNTLQSQWQVLSHDYEMATTQLNQTQKHLLMAEEANKILEKQLKDLQESACQQITYLKDQDEKNRALFKEQLETQEQKSEERYTLLKNENFHEKVALQQMIEKISEQNKVIEADLHQKQIEVEQSRGEVRRLEGAFQESQNQQNALQQENRELIVQIRGKDDLILQAKNDKDAIQQQLQNFQIKIDNLQEEKLILIQEKFQFEKNIHKEKSKNDTQNI